jgi:hypothetical protein
MDHGTRVLSAAAATSTAPPRTPRAFTSRWPGTAGRIPAGGSAMAPRAALTQDGVVDAWVEVQCPVRACGYKASMRVGVAERAFGSAHAERVTMIRQEHPHHPADQTLLLDLRLGGGVAQRCGVVADRVELIDGKNQHVGSPASGSTMTRSACRAQPAGPALLHISDGKAARRVGCGDPGTGCTQRPSHPGTGRSRGARNRPFPVPG